MNLETLKEGVTVSLHVLKFALLLNLFVIEANREV